MFKADKLPPFVIFLLVGGATAVVYFSLLSIIIGMLGVWYPAGVSISYVLAVSFHFVGNRWLTFCATGHSAVRQLKRYIVVSAFNYMATLAIVFITVEFAHRPVYWGAVFSILATTGLGFVASKFWVFKKNENIS